MRGRLVLAGLEHPELVQVTLWTAGEGHFLELAGNGCFEAEASPGRYRVVVRRGTQDLLSTPEFELVAGGATDIGDLQVEAPGAVEIELTGIPAGALSRTHFSLDHEGVDSVQLTWTDGR